MAEEINNEKTYHLIFTGKYLTAEEARQMYKPAHTVEEILKHIKRRAGESHKITGYEFERMPKSVINKLQELGYTIYSEGIGTVTISWE